MLSGEFMEKLIGIVSGSKKRDGIQIGMKGYYDTLSKHFRVNWYQCIDPAISDTTGFGIPVRGVKFPIPILEMGINRLFAFPKRFYQRGEDLFILADPTLVGITKKAENVLVKIHDLRPLTAFADSYLTRLMYLHSFNNLQKVKGVIVTTEWMANQIKNYLNKEQVILVIADTHSIEVQPERKIEGSIDRLKRGIVNITYVATDRPYKNIPFFLDLARELTRHDSVIFNFRLVSKISHKTKRIIQNNEIPRFTVYQNVEDIGSIYEDTDIYLHPSFYEGFGRPIIEAMACGIPVVTNSIEPFYEIMGGAGKQIPVSNKTDWISAILQLSEPDFYKIEAKKSLERSMVFDQKHFEKQLCDELSRTFR